MVMLREFICMNRNEIVLSFIIHIHFMLLFTPQETRGYVNVIGNEGITFREGVKVENNFFDFILFADKEEEEIRT